MNILIGRYTSRRSTFFLLLFLPLVSLWCPALYSRPEVSHPDIDQGNGDQNHWQSPISSYYVGRAFGEGDSHAVNIKSAKTKKTRKNRRQYSTPEKSVHRGIDMMTTVEAPIVAPMSGIIMVSAHSDPFYPGRKDLIVIDHGNNRLSVITNLGDRLVKTGNIVRRGQRIAMTKIPDPKTKLASTHIELIENGRAVDPFIYLPYVFFNLQLNPH